ncbi:MAG: hypothetical protein U9O06_00145 [Euryarchaeota archaeon]|nr:hypothetical protein [Euryarchaeota archaeon]
MVSSRAEDTIVGWRLFTAGEITIAELAAEVVVDEAIELVPRDIQRDMFESTVRFAVGIGIVGSVEILLVRHLSR